MATIRDKSFELETDADTFMRGIYLDATFIEALYRQGLGFLDFELVSQRGAPEAGPFQRTLRLQPPSNAPKVVQKVLGSTQEYQEEGALDPDSGIWSYEVTPATMASRINIRGTMRAAQLSPSRCRAMFEAHFEARIFGVGSAVERFMASQFDENLKKQEAFMRRWIARAQ